MSISSEVPSDSEHLQQRPLSEQPQPQFDTDDGFDNAIDPNICGMCLSQYPPLVD